MVVDPYLAVYALDIARPSGAHSPYLAYEAQRNYAHAWHFATAQLPSSMIRGRCETVVMSKSDPSQFCSHAVILVIPVRISFEKILTRYGAIMRAAIYIGLFRV